MVTDDFERLARLMAIDMLFASKKTANEPKYPIHHKSKWTRNPYTRTFGTINERHNITWATCIAVLTLIGSLERVQDTVDPCFTRS